MTAKSDNYNGTIELTAPTGGVTAGTMYSIQALVCLALTDADATDSFVAKIEGKITGVTKVGGTGLGWTAGQRLYWDDSASSWTTTATGNNATAYAAADATAAATTGDIILLPQLSSVV